jgi:hypothetical protein
MTHEHKLIERQRGSIILLVVALLLAFAMAGVGLITQQATSRHTAIEQGLSSAAKNAAQSGAGYILSQIFYPDKSRTQADSECAAITGSITFSVPGLTNCTAALSCASSWSAGSTEHNYDIESTGQCGSGESTTRSRTRVVAKR